MSDKSKPAPAPVDPATWVDTYGDYFFRFAISRLRDRQTAEEVVQETFVAGIKGLSQYQGTGSEKAWLLGILRRKIVDVIRRRSRQVASSAAETDEDLSERLFDARGHWKDDPRIFGRRPDESMQREEFWKTVQQCIQTLPQRQADAFTLRELEDQSSEEICKELGLTTSNLWVLLHRARLRLASCLKMRWAGAQSG